MFSSDFQTPGSGLREPGAAELFIDIFIQLFIYLFFNQLRGVWKSDETLFRVYDIVSQTNGTIMFGEIQSKTSRFQTSFTVVISFLFFMNCERLKKVRGIPSVD